MEGLERPRPRRNRPKQCRKRMAQFASREVGRRRIRTRSRPPASAEVSAIRLEVLADPSLPHHGPGRQDNGNLHLSEFRVKAGDTPIAITSATADFDQAGWDIHARSTASPTTAWGIYPAVGRSHEAMFVLKQPIPANSQLTVELDQLHGGGHLIGRARLSGTNDGESSAHGQPDSPGESSRFCSMPSDKRTRGASGRNWLGTSCSNSVEAKLAVAAKAANGLRGRH